MDINTQSAPSVRPHFVPEGIDFSALPEALRLAFVAIVEPAYRELVQGAETTLERSAGTSLTFLLAQEVLDQQAIGWQPHGQDGRDAEREKLMHRHLRLLSSKQQASNFLLRLTAARARVAPDPLRQPVEGEHCE